MAKELAVVDVTTIQYMNKWKVLKREYQKTVDHNAQTGTDKKLCQFYDELRTQKWDLTNIHFVFKNKAKSGKRES